MSTAWQKWEKRPPFKTKDGRWAYPHYALGAHDRRYEGGTILVHKADVNLDDIEYRDGLRQQIGSLTWNRREIQYITVEADWMRQGVAREMLRLAREAEPHLRHAPCARRSVSGELFVRATDPNEACLDHEALR